MKYISLDVETTSLNRSPKNVLQLSAVFEDSSIRPLSDVKNLPHFTCFIDQGDIRGSAYALGMNGWILDIISGRKENTTGYPVLSPTEAWDGLIAFVKSYFGEDRANLAGKNAAGFDYWFLPDHVQRLFRGRIIDPGSVYVDWSRNALLGLDALKKEKGISGEVSHDARDDACDVISLLRKSY